LFSAAAGLILAPDELIVGSTPAHFALRYFYLFGNVNRQEDGVRLTLSPVDNIPSLIDIRPFEEGVDPFSEDERKHGTVLPVIEVSSAGDAWMAFGEIGLYRARPLRLREIVTYLGKIGSGYLSVYGLSFLLAIVSVGMLIWLCIRQGK
jgi:hypothetical protein